MKKKRCTLLPLFLLTVCLCAFAPVSAAEQTAAQDSTPSTTDTQESFNGYVTVDGKTYYYKNGQKHTGRVKIDDTYYYFLDGIMQKSYWYTSKSGSKYYFRANGQMAVGRVKIKDTYYYYGKNYFMVS
ncbi:MAG: hypothetical protein LIP11_09745 [Clostridiales bacterium]|nr:hypothetical protein [Clostridiales bacterium]